MSDVEEPTGEEPPIQEPIEEPAQVSDVPTVVVGKKRASRAKQVTVEEPVEEPVPEVKPKAKAKAKAKAQPKAKARATLPAEAPAVTEPPPKTPRQKKTKPEEEPPSKAEWQPTRLLSDMNDFTSRIQELHKLNELHRKNMYRELLGGMV